MAGLSLPFILRDHDSTHGPHVLDATECWERVRESGVGRLAFVVENWPVVLPVNFCTDGDDVVLRSGEGLKLSTLRRSPAVALEVDSFEPLYRSGWSVLLLGTASVVDDPDESGRLDALGLRPWAASERASWLRVHPLQITGRRLARAWRYPDLPI
ncbi:MAG TPA: pyridoxamine 5'-phosphate oxidase family protein [Nocardioidaceae bacterium]|jgi:nitroimidazol reductase NimA-like FMN-containing flavoprotein (pyridoxamine 5'-phosphate oxidase superfamily)